MSGDLDEPTLIQSARRGDLQAFNTLVDRYQDLLFRIAVRMLGDQDSAADATQTAWISAFHHLHGYRGGQFKTWLARVVVNACYDEIRRKHRRREVALVPTNGDGEEMDGAYWLADRAPSVEEQVDMKEFDRVVNECLQSLKPVFRSMLILVDIEGLSYEEAAAAAGVPLGTVRSRVARARVALRKCLQEATDLTPDPQRYQDPMKKQQSMRYA
jgi:RNA polymerase sigma-70 factor, ECF subfamily